MTTKSPSKKTLIPITLVIAVLGCVLAVNAYITSNTMRQNLVEERYKRLRAEQQLQSNQSDLAAIRADLEVAQKKLAGIQQIVNQGQEIHSELQQQYEQVQKERDALMAQLEKLKVTAVNPAADAVDQ